MENALKRVQRGKHLKVLVNLLIRQLWVLLFADDAIVFAPTSEVLKKVFI